MTYDNIPYTINTQLFHFPTTKIREVVMPNEDGSFTILIADWLDPFAMQREYNHALWHIINNDFYSEKSVQEIECEAHRGGF